MIQSCVPVPIPILREVDDADRVGAHLGQVKWWNDRLGYGFITVCRGPDRGKDIFVHHTGIRPLSSHYRTLYKGEYVQFDIQGGVAKPSGGSEVLHGHAAGGTHQATNVTGVDGGCLMCDVVPQRPSSSSSGAGRGGYTSSPMPNRSGTTS